MSTLSFQFRATLVIAFASLALDPLAAPAHAQPHDFSISAQALDTALREFALQRKRDVLFAPEIVAGKRSPGVRGRMTEAEALTSILQGTELVFKRTTSGYVIRDSSSGERRKDETPADPVAAQGQPPATVIEVDLPAQPMDAALKQLAEKHKLQVVFSTNDVKGLNAPEVKGRYSIDVVMQKLTAGTKLRYQFNGNDTILVRAGGGVTQSPNPLALAQNQRAGAEESGRDKPPTLVENITVTGTNIRGATDGPASSVVIITQEEIRRSGLNNLGEVARSMPQGFSGGQNPNVTPGGNAVNPSNFNLTGSSSFNLRGLGPDATLTLLNGARLPYDGYDQAIDVSAIPIAAIDHVEVLLDGASAIYGSDAVAGVANIILKKDYKGAELAARLGTSTDGGYTQNQYIGLTGTTWDSGGFLLTADISRNTPVRARHRDYLRFLANQDTTIYPDSRQGGALFSGHQRVGSFAEFTLNATYSDRSQEDLLQDSFSRAGGHKESTIWSIAPNVQVPVADWLLTVHGALGENDAARDTRGFSVATGREAYHINERFLNKGESAALDASGPVIRLPGGAARIAVGVGYRRNTFELTDFASGVSNTRGSDASRYGYAEVSLPLVSGNQATRFAEKLVLSGAVRHEDYDGFGGVTTPKIGVIWSPVQDFDVKASWGKSFKVPTLRQQFEPGQLYLYPASLFSENAPPNGTVLLTFGGNPDLTPERAKTFVVGFVARPGFLDGFKLEVTGFNLKYRDRVVIPIAAIELALVDPTVAAFVTRTPTVGEQNAIFRAIGLPVGTFTGNFGAPDFSTVPYDPANVIAIIDDRYFNAAFQKLKGVDVSATYDTQLFKGYLTILTAASWIDGERVVSSLAPVSPATGIVFFPPKFRARVGASWEHNRFVSSSYINHIGGVTNNNVAGNPRVASMTTVDLVLQYQWASALTGDAGLSIAVANALNERPPFMQPLQTGYVNYDSTNYSALGRVVNVTVTKRF
jgi:iron complex outermembrane receptor protein